jgi:hypothetical protein
MITAIEQDGPAKPVREFPCFVEHFNRLAESLFVAARQVLLLANQAHERTCK